ncbi:MULTISPECIES: hydroxymethylglutaryl-CoA lyase [Brevibacterium]|jgi:hydroxymethylglutaryl-CoA lyase|uniref:Hydroxymethylglutaryl-CoA lyase n=1 Tax=Brevibacterium salitolerans TaxID=1403566 RepID=A0ABN2X2K1_9MICO|nr:hydroxymethylglutaryl-CoA lyase [Brevibacterium sp.]
MTTASAAPVASARPVPALRDVTLRDGLQLTGGLLATETKLEVIRELLAAGVPQLEIGSMARPDLVPPLANTLEVVAELTPEELDRSWVWVATPRNVERAVAAGVTRMQYCLSVSDAHNRANVGRSAEESMAALPRALDIAAEAGAELQLCLATAFTCPFDGPVDPERTLGLVKDPRAQRCTEVVVADTLGQADPAQVGSLVAAADAAAPGHGIVFHGHDTWGMGAANALAAARAGAVAVDGALGGLGGCPFAPGASGNTSSEDILFALKPEWLTPERFARIVRLGERITEELGERSTSKAAQGARSRAEAFGWVIR